MAENNVPFVGPGRLDSPPYESVYRDGGCVMGPSTYAVLQIYQEAGFHPGAAPEPADHIAHELLFMSRLCGREANLWGVEDLGAVSTVLASEDRFQNEHLCRWTPDFCSRLNPHHLERVLCGRGGPSRLLGWRRRRRAAGLAGVPGRQAAWLEDIFSRYTRELNFPIIR